METLPSATDVAVDSDFHGDVEEYDDDFASNEAVGDLSPLYSNRFLQTFSLNDEPLEEMATSDGTGVNSEDAVCTAATSSPTRVVLNEANLASFETSIKQGSVPLRVDTVGEGFVNPTVDSPSKNVCHPSMSMATNQPVRSETMASLDTTQLSRADTYDEAASAASNQGQGRKSGKHRHHYHHDADKLSMISMEAIYGSPNRPFSTDPLNAENLRIHLNDLCSGRIQPLRPENIVGYPALGNVGSRDDIPSIAVEPSEAEAHGSEYSGVLYDRTPHKAEEHQRAIQHLTEGLDELWSTCSTSATADREAAAQSGVPSHLSRESLLQLRRQLERGETPLRPELLAGIGDFVKAFQQTCPNRSASLNVEAPDEREHSVSQCAGEEVPTVYSSPHDFFASESIHNTSASPIPTSTALRLHARRQDRLNSTSFHSTMAEGAATEVMDNDDDDDVGADDNDNEDDDDDDMVAGAVRKDDFADTNDVENDNDSYYDGAQRGSHVDNTVHTNMEDIAHLRGCVGKLFKEMAKMKSQNQQMSCEMKVLSSRLGDEHDLIHSTEERIVDKLVRTMATLQQHIMDVGSRLNDVHTRLVGVEHSSGQGQWQQQGQQIPLTLRYTHGNNLPTTFVVPMLLSATVGECKNEFLRRLQAHNLIASDVPIKYSVLLFGDEEHVLFDNDPLGAVLPPSVQHSGGGSTGECILSLHVLDPTATPVESS